MSDQINRYFFLIHPLLDLLINLHINGVNIEEWIKNLTNEISITDYGIFSKKDVLLIYNKFKLLKENYSFFEKEETKKTTGRLTSFLVKQSFTNTSSVVFEVTEKCNLACDYCCYGNNYTDFSRRNNQNLPLNKAISLLDYLFSLRNTPLNKNFANKLQIGFYGGEPLLNISFIDGIINYLKTKKDLKNEFVLTMTTNGVLLDKYMDYLVENCIHFSISLDGNKINNSFRVFHNKKSSFYKVFNNVKKFKEKYPKYFKEHVRFISVLHKKNSFFEISSFMKREFNKESTISEINHIGINADKIEDFNKIYKNPFEDMQQNENYTISEKTVILNSANRASVTKTLHQFSSFVYKNYSELLFGNSKFYNIIPTSTCFPFQYKIFLTASGKILPCERIEHQFSLGEIRDDNLVQLDFEKIAKMYNDIYDKMEGQCSNCYNILICGQCAFYIKNIEKEKPTCLGCLSKSEFTNYLSLQISYLEKYPSQYSFIMKKIIGR